MGEVEHNYGNGVHLFAICSSAVDYEPAAFENSLKQVLLVRTPLSAHQISGIFPAVSS